MTNPQGSCSKTNMLYLIGSLRNERVPKLAQRLREENTHTEVFDDWYSAGPRADDHWKEHQKSKGLTYEEALKGYAARNVFEFDKRHLDRATHALLVLPAGKSGHMEIMYAAYGVGAKAAILLDPEDVRWDVMYQFIPTILNNDEEINEWLNSPAQSTTKANPDLTSYLNPRCGVLPRYLPSGPINMQPITGEGASNTPVSSGQRCVTSRRLMTERTSTPKA